MERHRVSSGRSSADRCRAVGFYEGPPTANGRPGLHHVWARVYKDLFCRYRTCGATRCRQGRVGHPRPAGGGGGGGAAGPHGNGRSRRRSASPSLPASVEKLVRTTSTSEDPPRAHRRPDRHRRRLLDLHPGVRRGHLVDLKSIWEQGLLYEDIKVVPYRRRAAPPSAATSWGSPTLPAGGGPVGYVRFPVPDEGEAAAGVRAALGRDSLEGLTLVAWTTPPWTLLPTPAWRSTRASTTSSSATTSSPPTSSRRPSASARRRPLSGAALVGLRYRRRSTTCRPPGRHRDGWRWRPATSWRPTRGPHRPPGPRFGEVDRQVGREHGLPTLNPVGPDGRSPPVPWLRPDPSATPTAP